MSNAAKRILDTLYPAPSWLPQAFDPTGKWVRMVEFTAEDYRAAPFLDRRGMRAGMRFANLPFELLARRTPADARREANWIFHISHVGSTLISRLLGEVRGVLALREPPVLNVLPGLPEEDQGERLPVLRALLSRVFDKGQLAMVKAPSRVNDLAASLAGPPGDGGKAAMIRMAPERFIAGRLIGKRVELRSLAPARLERLKLRLPNLDKAAASCDDARLAAAAWATEASAIEVAARMIGNDRAHFVDFDQFLAEPLSCFEALARHFDLAPGGEALAAIIEGPLMTRYSKNSVKPFDAGAREAAIAAQLGEEREAIAGAMHWLHGIAKQSPDLAAALDRTPV